MEEGSKSFVNENPENEAKDSTRFRQSLQELKELRSQLYRAADFCETTFFNAKQKQVIVGNTKEYVYRAVITVIDHLGSVSANLEYALSATNTVSQLQLRVNCLKQKISTCEEYSRKQALRKVCWNANFERYHPRYIAPPTPFFQRSNIELQRNLMSSRVGAKSSMVEVESEEVPLLLNTYNNKASLSLVDNKYEKKKKKKKKKIDNNKSFILEEYGDDKKATTTVLPVRNGVSLLPKSEIPSFHFQETPKLRRHVLNWKSMQNNDFISSLRRSKRAK